MALATVNTTANTTPDPGQGGSVAVTGATNTGHASTTASKSGAGSQVKSCIWSGFPSVGGQIVSVNLKVDWTQDGSLTDGGVSTSNQFEIDYSLNNGSSWNTLKVSTQIQSSSSGTSTQALSVGQDLTQVKVRDTLTAVGVAGETASVTASVSQIRIEVTTIDPQVIAMM